MSQLGHRLSLSPQRLRSHKALEIKRVFPREHVIHSPAQLMGEHGQGFSLAVLVCPCGEIFFAGLTLAEEAAGRFGKGSKSKLGAGSVAFDFAALRSDRT